MKSILASMGAACALLLSNVAHAALIDQGGGLIYDDTLNLTWLSDANYAKTSGYSANGLMTWDESVAWAAQLSFHDSVRNVDHSNWRLPNAVAQNFFTTGSELAHLRADLGGAPTVNLYATATPTLLALFSNITPGLYWPGNQYSPGSLASLDFVAGQGSQEGYNTGPNATRHYAWAVSEGNIAAAVPEPDTYVLLLAGLAVIGLLARHRHTERT
jgi:hypothetical protein